MAEKEKESGFMGIIKTALRYVSQIISEIIIPPLEEGADMVMKKIDDRMVIIEKRIMKKLTILFITGFGIAFLILALFFYMIDYLRWSKTLAFFSIGIIVFVMGLLLKIKESEK